MSAARRAAPMIQPGRSNHAAFMYNNILYAWGGYKVVSGENESLPSDEIWLCNLDTMTWERREIFGEKLPDLSGFCGSHLSGSLYVFGGCDRFEYTNKMFSLDLGQERYVWKRVTGTRGAMPFPRIKHSCWVHRHRLIYFGGYGFKTMTQNTSLQSFIVEEMSWKSIGNSLFMCWGWNNETHVFDTGTATWSVPETRGSVPSPRACHGSAVLGNKGYISGGQKIAELDMFCLDFETWTWTRLGISETRAPPGCCMFTMTPISDHTLFIYGGLSIDGHTLNEALQFDTLKSKWTRMAHPHKDKPRACHTACMGSDSDVVVFGGSSNTLFVNSESALKSVPQHNYSDMFIFQTQPYSLFRLCEDFIRKNPALFEKQLNRMPSILCRKINGPFKNLQLRRDF
ncbi:kelch domain-containing protein 1-like [Brachionichthys hirsutus]|uniref:kelch domain-containing protein 1-like n=1 Tax=Brachionichthys hirsutus TaxID=412623 RepID=UPI003604E413